MLKLNREVTVSQYITQDTGVQMEASQAVLNPYDTIVETYNAAVNIINTAGEVAQKAINWLAGKGYKTDEEVKKDEEEAAAKKAEEERLRKEQEEAEKKAAEEAKRKEELEKESPLMQKMRENGVEIKDGGSGKNLKPVSLNQSSLGTGYDGGLCLFSVLLGIGNLLSGKELTLDVAKLKYKEAVDEGYIKNGNNVVDYGGVLGLMGANYQVEYKNLALTVSDNDVEMNRRIIENLNEGLPVIIHLNSKTDDQHKEYITDYTKIGNELYYKINDSGGIKDIYIKASTWETYHEDEGELKVTKTKSGVIRKATNISFITSND